jgi:hypothetical protein
MKRSLYWAAVALAVAAALTSGLLVGAPATPLGEASAAVRIALWFVALALLAAQARRGQ